MEQDLDIYENHHCTEDGCPVNDLLKEEQLLKLSIQERAAIGLKNAIEEQAMDAYWLVMETGGTAKEAQDAFFKCKAKLYADLH